MARVMDSAGAGRRQLVRTSTAGAGALLFLALLVIVNYFGWKYHHRFDWTETQLYTLSEKTENVLADLEQDVQFVVFLPPGDELSGPVAELLARYEAASPRVKVRSIDPERNPIEAQQLVQQYQITGTGVVVTSGEDRRVIEQSELADFDFSGLQMGQGPQMTGFKGEQLFTGAIVELVEGEKPKILFTTGHGEARLDDTGARGLAGAREILGTDNVELEEWASLGKPAVPEGTDLVVIAGPRASFVPPELDMLAAFVERGGRLLVMLDPTMAQTAGGGLADTGLGPWLARWGVVVGDNIVVDPGNPLPFFGPETIFVNDYGDHPLVRPLREADLPVLLALDRSVGRGEAPGLTVTELLRTSPEGWGETNLVNLERVQRDASDLGGPVPLGVAVERADEGADGGGQEGQGVSRLVVFGDSDFATNQLLQANEANGVLLSNALNWLVERETLLGIPPKKPEQVRLALTQGELRFLYLVALVLLPGLGVALGVFVWLRRRR